MIVEREMLKGQTCQGHGTAVEIHEILAATDRSHDFPLFCAVYEILEKGRRCESLLEGLMNERVA